MLRNVAFILAILSPTLVQCAGGLLFVSPKGSDTNPGTREKPLATLERARDALREARAAGKLAGPARIVLRGGVYYLPQTLTLEPQDSDLTIEAAFGEDVTLSGGRLVTGWKPWKGSILQADLSKLGLPDLSFRELYCDSQRQPLARTPNFDPRHPRRGGFLYNARVAEPGSNVKLAYREGELNPAKWAHPERALVMSYCTGNACYQNCLSGLVKVDQQERVLTLDAGVYAFEAGDRYYVCNVLEELDAPGEWCADPDTKMLYFWPPAQGKERQVVVPALTSAFVIQGDVPGGKYVEGVRLAGLNLRDFRGAAVHLTGAKACTVAACDIRNANFGVHLEDETHACRVVGCDITQTGNEPIRIEGTPSSHERVSGHVIDNNYLHDFGYGYFDNMNAGVFLTAASHCQITHNHIHDGPRFGLSMNGGDHNVMAYNHLHHMNLETCDCGLIYTVTSVDWGKPDEAARNLTNAGNEIHHNLMHDAGGYGRNADNRFEYPHYSWGIYLDLACSDWSVHDNVVYNTVLGGFHVNGGERNACVNNILGNAAQTQLRLAPWPKYTMSGNQVRHNIIADLTPGAVLYDLGAFEPQYATFASNLVYSGGRSPKINAAQTRGAAADAWRKWQAFGQDQGSLVADPQFVDTAHGDYRLKATSPARQVGFRPIDLSTVGNYKSPDRRTWPRPEIVPFREPGNYTPKPPTASQPPLRTYEESAVGEGERGASAGIEAGLSSVLVTDETAAPGLDGKPSHHSLKFTDAAGQKYPWDPYVAYVVDWDEGLIHAGFDLRWEQGAIFTYEWRDDPAVYHLGPNLAIAADGWLAANGKRLLQVPAGQWVRFDVVCGLGSRATGTYDLTIRLPGSAPQVFKALACDPKFAYLEQFVFMSNTDGPSVFYIDNVEIRPEAGK